MVTADVAMQGWDPHILAHAHAFVGVAEISVGDFVGRIVGISDG